MCLYIFTFDYRMKCKRIEASHRWIGEGRVRHSIRYRTLPTEKSIGHAETSNDILCVTQCVW